jgi:hypothetical protein
MPTMKHRIAAAVFLSSVLAAQGCSGTTSPSPAGRAITTPTTQGVPNPFTIVNRFTPDSLGHGLEHFIWLAIGPDDNLYVTDTSDQVAVISPHGDVLREWGTRGIGQGEFKFDPHDPSDPFDIHAMIAVAPDGRVVVTDYGNERVPLFTSTGGFIGYIGSFGPQEGQLLDAFQPVFDAAGNLYIADDKLGMISKFSPDGTFDWRVGGSNGEIDPKTLSCDPHPGGVDPHDRLIVQNGCNWILYVDTGDGRIVDEFESRTCDVSVDALGDVYANRDSDGCTDGLTKVYDRTHRLIGEWADPDNAIGQTPQFGPNGEIFAVGNDGSILQLSISLPGA